MLIEHCLGGNYDFLKDQYALWPQLVRLPRLIHDVVEYNRLNETDDEKHRALRQRAYELHSSLNNISSPEGSSLESLQLEFYDPNTGSLSRIYGILATMNYVGILTATSILIDRLIRFLDSKYHLTAGWLLWPHGQLSTEEYALRNLLRACYAWWKAPSPAFIHSKHADMMFSESFRALDALDNRGTLEEITNGPGAPDSQKFYDHIPLLPRCTSLPVGLFLTCRQVSRRI